MLEYSFMTANFNLQQWKCAEEYACMCYIMCTCRVVIFQRMQCGIKLLWGCSPGATCLPITLRFSPQHYFLSDSGISRHYFLPIVFGFPRWCYWGIPPGNYFPFPGRFSYSGPEFSNHSNPGKSGRMVSYFYFTKNATKPSYN